ncbi:alpha-amylase-like isoform X2 [Brevipalpus obovatus]
MKVHLLIIVLVSINSVKTFNGNNDFDNPHFKDDRTTLVELWEWRFDEVGKECERFLGPNKYGGVLVSPAWEHEQIDDPVVNNKYGLVSYRIMTRYGNEAQLANMIKRCNSAGVRVYVDCNVGSTTFPYDGKGFGGTPFYGTNKSYPGVPYTYDNFNSAQRCSAISGDIEDPRDLYQLRDCQLTGINDLDNGQKYVQDKIVEAINKLINLGVAGIRIDASYMSWPKNLAAILERLNTLNTKFFKPNSKPYVFHSIKYESTLGRSSGPSPSEYVHLGSVVATDARRKIVDSFRKRDYDRIKNLDSLRDDAWTQIPSKSAVTLIDSAAYQDKDIPDGINFRLPYTLIRATSFMLAWPYGLPLVMSNFNYTIEPVPAFWKESPQARKWPAARAPIGHDGYSADVKLRPDSSCSEPWICEHR